MGLRKFGLTTRGARKLRIKRFPGGSSSFHFWMFNQTYLNTMLTSPVDQLSHEDIRNLQEYCRNTMVDDLNGWSSFPTFAVRNGHQIFNDTGILTGVLCKFMSQCSSGYPLQQMIRSTHQFNEEVNKFTTSRESDHDLTTRRDNITHQINKNLSTSNQHIAKVLGMIMKHMAISDVLDYRARIAFDQSVKLVEIEKARRAQQEATEHLRNLQRQNRVPRATAIQEMMQRPQQLHYDTVAPVVGQGILTDSNNYIDDLTHSIKYITIEK